MSLPAPEERTGKREQVIRARSTSSADAGGGSHLFGSGKLIRRTIASKRGLPASWRLIRDAIDA